MKAKPACSDGRGMLQGCSQTLAAIAVRRDIPLDERHVVLHSEIRPSRDCPGTMPARAVAGARALHPGGAERRARCPAPRAGEAGHRGARARGRAPHRRASSKRSPPARWFPSRASPAMASASTAIAAGTERPAATTCGPELRTARSR